MVATAIHFMQLDEYKSKFQDDSSPGWDALNVPLQKLYGEQEPKHWGTVISYMLGGPDPIDGISAYSCDGDIDHLHFITFGYSSLYYDEESVGGDFSKFGFEMTFRLASNLPPKSDPIWVVNFLQNIARYVFESGKHFGQYHWLPANGPIRSDSNTDIVGIGFAYDTVLPSSVETPHGQVEFIQGFGLVQSEVNSLMDKTRTVKEILDSHRQSNPLLVTDLARQNDG